MAMGPTTWLMMAGAVAVIIGSFLDWATAFGGLAAKSGMDGDGVITLVTGIVMLLVAFLMTRGGGKAKNIVFGLAAAISLLVAIIDLIDVGSTDEVSIGIGLWIVAIGAVVAIVGFVRELKS